MLERKIIWHIEDGCAVKKGDKVCSITRRFIGQDDLFADKDGTLVCMRDSNGEIIDALINSIDINNLFKIKSAYKTKEDESKSKEPNYYNITWYKKDDDMVKVGDIICTFKKGDRKIRDYKVKIEGQLKLLEKYKSQPKRMHNLPARSVAKIKSKEQIEQEEREERYKKTIIAGDFDYTFEMQRDPFTDDKFIDTIEGFSASETLEQYFTLNNEFSLHIISPFVLKSEGSYYWQMLLYFECINSNVCIVLMMDKKYFNLSAGEGLILLFDNGDTIKYICSQNSSKKDKSIVTNRFCLYDDDLEKFETSQLEGVRIFNDESEYCSFKTNVSGLQKLMLPLQKHYAHSFRLALDRVNISLPKKTEEENIVDEQYLTGEKCYVYLMFDTATSFYKIGISNSPEYREKTLQSEKPTIIKICSKAYPHRKIAMAIETALHNTFKEKNVRGEWFNLSDDEVRMIVETLM